MDIDPVKFAEGVGAISSLTGIGWFGKWLIGRVQRLERENRDSHIDCQKKNVELEKKIGEIYKLAYDAAIADRTLLITTLERNTTAVDRNSITLDLFSSSLLEKTPPRGNAVQPERH